MAKKGSRVTTARRAAGFLIGAGVLFWVIGWFYAELEWSDSRLLTILVEFLYDLSPELIGIAVGVLIIDRIVEQRDAHAENQRLIRQLGSENNALAVTAARELDNNDLLKDGRLGGHNFRRANLHRAKLDGADFSSINANSDEERTILRRADLSESVLYRADFSGADMKGVSLHNAFVGSQTDREKGARFLGTDLFLADLSNSRFYRSDFKHAKLERCNLRGAKLQHAENLETALLWGSFYDETTSWPSPLATPDARKAKGCSDVTGLPDPFPTGATSPLRLNRTVNQFDEPS